MKRILDLLKNKFFLAGTAFIVWMLFFDRNDLASQYEYRTKVQKLEEEKAFYTQEISKAEDELKELTTNMGSLEKFARERYFMKKENEDLYVIMEQPVKNE
jgi:cell division protein FtsB